MKMWIGMEDLDLQEVEQIHNSSDRGLLGLFFLYSDGTTAIIPSGYEWEDIVSHYANGDVIGREAYQGEWWNNDIKH